MKPESVGSIEDLIKQRKLLDQELEKFQKHLTVSFVDIVGSTSYFERHGDVAGMIYVHKCIDMMIPVAEKHGGTICKTIGDAVMTSNDDAVKAVQAAIDMQLALESYNQGRTEDEIIRVRIGLNYGLGLIKEKDVFGDVVNVAARIEASAKAEQIFISADLEKQVRAANFPLRRISDLSAKGKERPVSIYEVIWKQGKAGAQPGPPPRLPSPTVAGRTPVAEAAGKPPSGTVMLSAAALADFLKKPQVQYSLVVVRPDGTHGQSYVLDKQTSVLGRVEGEIVFPEDSLVSRRHARLTVTDEGLAAEDLNSANGVYHRLRKAHVLENGEVVLMGRQMFRFHLAAPAAEAPPAKDAKGGSATAIGMRPPAELKSGAAAGAAELIRILPGGVEENHYPLPPGEQVLGRTRGTINFPDDAYLSGQHACIRNENGVYTLEDMQAVNGTFVAVRTKVILTDGDILLIGHQLLRITATTP